MYSNKNRCLRMSSEYIYTDNINSNPHIELLYFIINWSNQFNTIKLCINWNLFSKLILQLKPGLLYKLTSDLYSHLFTFYPYVFENHNLNQLFTINKQENKIITIIYYLNLRELFNLNQYLFRLAYSTIPYTDLISLNIEWIYEDFLVILSNMLFQTNISLEEIEKNHQHYILLTCKYPFLNRYILKMVNKRYNSNTLLLTSYSRKFNENGWKWRFNIARKLADEVDRSYFGIENIYLFGSTNIMNAFNGSDIDLLIHIQKEMPHFAELENWLKKWNDILININYINTGIHNDYILDIHYITDDDVIKKTSYASLITSIENPVTVI